MRKASMWERDPTVLNEIETIIHNRLAIVRAANQRSKSRIGRVINWMGRETGEFVVVPGLELLHLLEAADEESVAPLFVGEVYEVRFSELDRLLTLLRHKETA